ncbi:hypothetical protein MBLNU457_g0423t1 [Dothideomycetes sp. NU457]
MGLPLWPNYKEEELKAKTKNAVKSDPTAAARSSIRRRAHRGAGDSGRNRGLTGARAQLHELAAEGAREAQDSIRQRALLAVLDDSLSRTSGPARRAHARRERPTREQQPAVDDALNQDSSDNRDQVIERSRLDAQHIEELSRNIESAMRWIEENGGPSGQFISTNHAMLQHMRDSLQRIEAMRGVPDELSQSLRRSLQRIEGGFPQPGQDPQDRAQHVDHELNSRLREVPRLRRETTRSSGFPGPEARTATLPTPPLEADQSGGASNQRLPTPSSASRHDDSRGLADLVSSARDYLETTRQDADGLGDRARSISAGDDTGDHWEIIRTTISEDEALASAGSSFAGTIAADSLASTDQAQTIGDDGWPSEYTSATEPTQDALHEAQTEECWDFYSESDDDDDVAQGLRPTHNELQREFRRRQASQFRRLNHREVNNGFTNRDRPSPGTQRPDRYGAELLQRSRDVANDVREFVRRERETLQQQREALNHRSATASRPTQIADTRSDMQSSADLLGTFSESMRHDDNDLEAMRGIVQRMVAREDIPDEFWLSAGLSRDTVRGTAPAAGRPSTSGGMRVTWGSSLAEPDGYPPSD